MPPAALIWERAIGARPNILVRRTLMVAPNRSFLKALLLVLAIFVSDAGHAEDGIDPPGRVGRIAFISGDVTLRNGDTDEWQSASINWPLVSHDVLWSGAGSRAEIRIGSTVVRLDSGTELEIVQLDDQVVRVWLHRGSITVRVADRDKAREFELTTDHGSVVWIEAGRYRFDYADYTTTVSAFRGQLHFAGLGQTYSIGQGQSAEIWYSGTLDSRLTELRRDEFYDWNLVRDQREDRRRSVRYVSAEMTGVEELDAYGDWRETAEFGAVWSPRLVPIGWSPYRHGRWAMIAPWGWTWIDEQPWGFAPFHYGRWAYFGNQWCWVPGAYVARPVYAPALVAWIGQEGSLQVAGGAPGVAWLPLGPREAYYPAYRSSTTYIRNINVSHVTNVTNIVVNGSDHAPAIDYVNRRQPNAVTVVAAEVVRSGRPVRNSIIREFDSHRLAMLPASQSVPLETPPHRDFHGLARNASKLVDPSAAPVAAVPQTPLANHGREATNPPRSADAPDARRIPMSPGQQDAPVSAPSVPLVPSALPAMPGGRPVRELREQPKALPVAAPAIKADPTPLPEGRQLSGRPKEKPRSAAPPPVAAERKKSEQAPPSARKPKREETNDSKRAGESAKSRATTPQHADSQPAHDHAPDRPAAEGRRIEKKPQADQPHQ
jgi:hypothetical protein